MKHKFLTFLVVLVLLASQFLASVNATTTTYYYVNAFDSTYVAWSESGASPYLSTINFPTAYIYQVDGASGTKEGNFDFGNSGSENGETLNNVYVECYLKAVDDIDYGFPSLRAYVYDGSTWTIFTVPVNNYAFAWKTVDVSSKINSWAKVDGCRVYLSVSCWAEGEIIVDCMRLKVLSTPEERGYELNLRVMDWDLTDPIQNAIVTMNNGSNNVKTSSSAGWANYTSVSGTVTVAVTYYGKNVNGTSITVSVDTTKNLQCKLYDVTITAKPNNGIGTLSGVNVTAYNDTGTTNGKIKTGITIDYTGQVTLTNLPNATLRFILRVKSDYTIIIANTTKTISSDGQTESIAGTQNYATVSMPWTPLIFIGSISSWCFNHKKTKRKEGGDSNI